MNRVPKTHTFCLASGFNQQPLLKTSRLEQQCQISSLLSFEYLQCVFWWMWDIWILQAYAAKKIAEFRPRCVCVNTKLVSCRYRVWSMCTHECCPCESGKVVVTYCTTTSSSNFLVLQERKIKAKQVKHKWPLTIIKESTARTNIKNTKNSVTRCSIKMANSHKMENINSSWDHFLSSIYWGLSASTCNSCCTTRTLFHRNHKLMPKLDLNGCWCGWMRVLVCNKISVPLCICVEFHTENWRRLRQVSY